MCEQLIAEGSSKLASVPSGGGGGGAVSSGGAAAGGGGAAVEEKVEEKKEEEKVSRAVTCRARVVLISRVLRNRRSPTRTWASVSSIKSLRHLYHCARRLLSRVYLQRLLVCGLHISAQTARHAAASVRTMKPPAAVGEGDIAENKDEARNARRWTCSSCGR